MNPLRRRLRLLRRVITYALASAVILAGLVVALASQLLPLVKQHPDEIAAWLSDRLKRPVALTVDTAEWTQRGPLLALEHMVVGTGADALDIGRAELLINIYAGLLPGQPLAELRLRGLDLVIRRDREGHWSIAGARGGNTGSGSSAWRQLQSLGELRLDAARVTVEDDLAGTRFRLDRVDGRIRNVGGRVRIGALARRGQGAPLRVAADLDAELANGQVYFGGEGIILYDWLEPWAFKGTRVFHGEAKAGLWANLRQRRVVKAEVELDAEGLILAGRLPDEAATESHIDPGDVSLAANWQETANGWHLAVSRLQTGRGDSSAELDIERDAGWTLRAARLEVGALLGIAALNEAVPESLRRFIAESTPQGRIDRAAARCADKGCSGMARISHFGWPPVALKPGLTGLAGELEFDPGAAVFRIDRQSIRLDAPGRFRAPIEAAITGRLVAYREEMPLVDESTAASVYRWHLATPELHLVGSDFAGAAQGELTFEPDSGRPRLDLYVETGPGPVSAAGRFWVLNHMSPRVVDWLDHALLDGYVERGRLLVAGDLDDWPFRNGAGHFEAIAETRDLRLDYRPGEWPPVTSAQVSARFINAGMEFEGQGEALGTVVKQASGAIPDFKKPVLDLHIAGNGAGENLLAFLRATPLQQTYGDQLAGVHVGGHGAVQVDVRLPLKSELGENTLEGHVDLAGADLRDDMRGLALNQASGRIRFSRGGFGADALQVLYAGQPGTFSLLTGGYVSDPAHTVEANLRGRFDIDSLLDFAPETHWLQPYAHGASEFSIGLSMAADGSQLLTAQSNLAGIALNFPQPLHKAAQTPLPLDLQLTLPTSDGQLQLKLGERLQLAAHLSSTAPLAGTLALGGAVGARPAAGLRIVGRAPLVDAAGWTGFTMGGGDSGNFRLESVDVQAGQLEVLGHRFAATRIVIPASASGDRQVRAEGADLAGEIQIPGSDLQTRGITAQFQTLHWPRSDSEESTRGLLTGLEPANVPPLHLWVKDFNFSGTDWGETRLETYPTADGMHIDRFESQSKSLQLRASGDWTVRQGKERSRFQLTFSAEDLGAMLTTFGYAGVIEGGQTLAEMEADWPGAPSVFGLEDVEGKLALSIGQGRIPEVKPGAGRILGLISLTEIPRRLALDFSDFFHEGLSFNTIRGNFVLHDGNAYTDNLAIDGPAAEIQIRGHTALKQKTYNQTMEVIPRTSGVLPVVGALAGGPAGAAIGAVAQAMLHRPLKQMTRTVYRVTGSWEAPVIDVIERGARHETRSAANGENPSPSPPEVAAPIPPEVKKDR